MADITKVYMITGFLGSGKTTFLNRIIKTFPKDRKLTILMNEFGEIGVDGTLIEGEDIDMMEISRGSIFCVCVKTDFIKGLYELNTKVQPDVLLIESTGVANPSDLKRDLKLPIFNSRFHYTEQFCIIDAAHFLEAFQIYASVEKQIASSTVFIINKVDLASPETVEAIKKTVHEFHPEPKFFETAYANIALEIFFPPETVRFKEQTDNTLRKDTVPVLSADQLEKFTDDLLNSPDLEITPPDCLVSVTYRWTGDNLDQIKSMAKSLPSRVLRAKGFIEEKGCMYIFNYVMGNWSIDKTEIPKHRIRHKNVLVFIAPPETVKEIENKCQTDNWTNLGIFVPSVGFGRLA